METVNDRIQIIVNDHFDGNKAAFAKAVGIAITSISNYLGKKRVSKPSVDMLEKIVNVLNVDALWLLTGREDNKDASWATANGEHSVAAVNSHVSMGESEAILKERINSLEQLLVEKERLINVLMDKK